LQNRSKNSVFKDKTCWKYHCICKKNAAFIRSLTFVAIPATGIRTREQTPEITGKKKGRNNNRGQVQEDRYRKL
jgi:hypothetical protein